MTVIEWLCTVQKLDFAVNNLIERKEELQTLATKVTAGFGDGMPHASGTTDKVGNCAVKLVELEQEIDRAIDRYVDYKTRVCAELMKLPTMPYQVLYLRFIGYKPYNQIAKELNYSTMQILRFKRAGIDQLEKTVGHVVESYIIPMV